MHTPHSTSFCQKDSRFLCRSQLRPVACAGIKSTDEMIRPGRRLRTYALSVLAELASTHRCDLSHFPYLSIVQSTRASTSCTPPLSTSSLEVPQHCARSSPATTPPSNGSLVPSPRRRLAQQLPQELRAFLLRHFPLLRRPHLLFRHNVRNHAWQREFGAPVREC